MMNRRQFIRSTAASAALFNILPGRVGAIAVWAAPFGGAPGEAFLRSADPQTGWITSLRRAGDTNRLEFLRPGQALGAVTLRVRTPGSPWREVRQSTNGVELASSFLPRGDALLWEISLKNTGTESLEIGDMALPLPMNAGCTAMTRGPFVLARDMKTGAMVPFADAGADGGAYRVWQRKAAAGSDSLLVNGVEGRSRPGNLGGSIIDGDFSSCVVTFGGKQRGNEDWFAVTLDAPVKIRRVVFAHGQSFHDGGWFVGKPKVQVQRQKGGAWETVGELDDYPATTATDGSKLKPGQTFTLRLASPVNAVAVRVLGVPASGDEPKQAFSSCAELQAFSK